MRSPLTPRSMTLHDLELNCYNY